MEQERGQERQGVPYEPQGEERVRFARAVREQIIGALGGLQSVIRFGKGQRFKFPVPEGDMLLTYVTAHQIGKLGQALDISAFVHFPCNIPHDQEAKDPFEVTLRFYFKHEDWKLPRHQYAQTDTIPSSPKSSPSLNKNAPKGGDWDQFRNIDAEHPLQESQGEEPPTSVIGYMSKNRTVIFALLVGATTVGFIIAEHWEAINRTIKSVRAGLVQTWDAIDGIDQDSRPTPSISDPSNTLRR